jgi:hypothetical protein
LPKLVTYGGAILLSDPLRPQAMEFLEKHVEASGDWSVTYEGRRVTVPGEPAETKDTALICLSLEPK